MSGIVGIVNLDGAPVDGDLLARLTEFMAYRGPDAQQTWIDGQVGFGHTMLRTTFEAETEKQPLTLDGKVWLTADARIDGRSELISELEAKLGRRLRVPIGVNGHGPESRFPNDAELILYAYEAWSEDCVKHLIGDFAFAIWDSRHRRLFCARDHFGVKPFYYAHRSKTFVFSNTLNCLRMHPSISDELNEYAIGDFLMFGFNHEPKTTTFADIQRIPPGYFLVLDCQGTGTLQQYWSLPLESRTTLKNSGDYKERFLSLLVSSTHDRMRLNRASVFMSGGLDSTSVAAVASGSKWRAPVNCEIAAHTIIHEQLIPDDEAFYSNLTAEMLRLPIAYQKADRYELYKGWERPEIRRPEPTDTPLLEMAFDQLSLASDRSRVALTGYGVDPALRASRSLGVDRLKRLEFVQLAHDIGWYLFSRHELPRLGFRSSIKGIFRKRLSEAPFPLWLKPDFVKRRSLRERWRVISAGPSVVHRERPEGYRSLIDPFWPCSFESYDPGVTNVPCEVRHPFFDVRMMSYLISIPVTPWCFDKSLLRESMRGILPEPVRLRPKTVLRGDPIGERLRQHDVGWIDDFEPHPGLGEYVYRHLIPKLHGGKTNDDFWMHVRPLCLNLWLQSPKTAQVGRQ